MNVNMELEGMVGINENILWKGKPEKRCFILESIFNHMLPVALIWGGLDFFIIGKSFTGLKDSASSGGNGMGAFLIVFFALHLMPVWLYLAGVIFSVRRYHNTAYIITDKGIYISGGTFTCNCEMKPFTDLSHINMHRGIFDQWIGVGDVTLECHHSVESSHRSNSSHGHQLSICDIADYQSVFQMIKQLQTDIYADTMYPNDMRPQENHGYRTEYKG